MNYLLTTIFFVSVVLYQCLNLKEGFFIRLNQLWEPSTIRVSLGNLKMRIHTQKAKANLKFEAVDAGSKRIRELGYILSFLGGRYPDFLFMGEREPTQRVYVREEVSFQYAASAQWVKDAFAEKVKSLVDDLTAKGIETLVLPIPTKIEFERDRLNATLPVDELWFYARTTRSMRKGEENPGHVYRQVVEAVPANTIDLRQALIDYSQNHSDAELFVPADSHWSSLGIAIAVKATVLKLIERGWKLSSPKLHALGLADPNYDLDLIRPFQLKESFIAWWGGFDWSEPIYEVSRVVPGKGRKGRVYVAGTCYGTRLQKEKQSYAQVLGRALGRTALDASVVMGGATAAFQRMRNQQWALSPGDLLIWEFPLRDPIAPTLDVPRPFVIQ